VRAPAAAQDEESEQSAVGLERQSCAARFRGPETCTGTRPTVIWKPHCRPSAGIA